MNGSQDTARGVAVVDNAQLFGSLLRETALRLGSGNLHVMEDPEALDPLLAAGALKTIFCDWRMPRQSGIDILIRVKRSNPDVRCVLLTGYKGDLTDSELHRLTRDNIELEVKDVISEEWLAGELGVSRRDDVANAFARDSWDDANQEEKGAPNIPEALAVARLERDKYRSLVQQQQRVIGQVAEGLAQDIERVPDGDSRGLFGTGQRLSVADFVEHIRSQTPFGLKLIEIDRKMQRKGKRG